MRASGCERVRELVDAPSHGSTDLHLHFWGHAAGARDASSPEPRRWLRTGRRPYTAALPVRGLAGAHAQRRHSPKLRSTTTCVAAFVATAAACIAPRCARPLRPDHRFRLAPLVGRMAHTACFGARRGLVRQQGPAIQGDAEHPAVRRVPGRAPVGGACARHPPDRASARGRRSRGRRSPESAGRAAGARAAPPSGARPRRPHRRRRDARGSTRAPANAAPTAAPSPPSHGGARASSLAEAAPDGDRAYRRRRILGGNAYGAARRGARRAQGRSRGRGGSARRAPRRAPGPAARPPPRRARRGRRAPRGAPAQTSSRASPRRRRCASARSPSSRRASATTSRPRVRCAARALSTASPDAFYGRVPTRVPARDPNPVAALRSLKASTGRRW